MRSGTIAFVAGVLVFPWFPDHVDPRLSGGLLSLLLLILLWAGRMRLPVLILAGLLWSMLRAAWILDSGLDPALEGRDLDIEGVVTSIPERRERGIRFRFRVDALHQDGKPHRSPGSVRLSWYGRVPPLMAGERWRFRVRLKRPRGLANPGGFDYERWLFVERIRATGYVRRDPGNRVLGISADPVSALNQLRQYLLQGIREALGDNPQGALIAALAVGDRGAIRVSQWKVLTASGTSHLLAISGLHIGLVAGFAYFLMVWLWSLPSLTVLAVPAQRIGALAGMSAALLYAALAGFSIPTQRALIMVSCTMGAVYLMRQVHISRVLLLAMLLVVLHDPFAVLGVGFWLSFTAVGFILYGMSARYGNHGLWWKWGRVQLLVTAGLTPLLLLFFQRASLVAPLANLVAVPWTGLVVVPLTLTGMLLQPVLNGPGTWLLQAAAAALELSWPLLDWLAGLPGAVWVHPVAGALSLAGALLGTVWILAPRGLPARWVGLVGLLPLLVLRIPAPGDGEFQITLLDVGQGLSAVVRTAKHTLVFDTGPRFGARFDSGTSVVIPYLRDQGIYRIDRLIISHGDNDHIGGANSILARLAVGEVITSSTRLLPGYRTQPCERDTSWNWDGVEFRFLHPPAGRGLRGNDASCVLRITAAMGSVLLTGDIERRAERQLLSAGAPELAARVLVAPHHGSRSSSGSGFIRAVDPEIVLFPAGYRNRYGFPHEEVIARYARAGVRRLDTGTQGAITLNIRQTDPHIDIQGYRSVRRRPWHTVP